jgi:DNA-binding response OmpR family regulator
MAHMTQAQFSNAPMRTTVHILVVEDERAIQKNAQAFAGARRPSSQPRPYRRRSVYMIRHEPIELVLLDILLPDMSGFEICREVRKFSDVPVVMLTALNRTEDIVQGFSLGADDYITKPFSLREVQGRLEAILRRIRWIEARPLSDQFNLNGVILNERTQTVTARDREVHLTPIEFRLLRYLMHRPDRPISKEELFSQVWGYELVGGTNLVEVAIRRLRSKIEEDASTPKLIITVHTVGYKFVSQQGDV